MKRYVADTLGSTTKLTDTSGAVTDSFEYWPYGEERSRTGTTAAPFTYVGTLGYYKDSSGRMYVRARTYLAKYARWLTVDPLWPDESPYGYAEGSPTLLTDPFGLACSPTDFQKCWDMGYSGCVETPVNITIGPICITGHIHNCTGDRKGRDYRNCRSLQAGCWAAVKFRPKGWDWRRWYKLCDECYWKCKSSGIIGAISSGCDFWNM